MKTFVHLYKWGRWEGVKSLEQPTLIAKDFESILIEQARNHSRWFFRLAYGILRDAHLAEDVCQQAFTKAWEQQARIRDAVTLKSWLTRVVINESLQVVRRRKTDQESRANCLSRLGTKMDTHVKVDFIESFRAALTELPEQTQVVVVLRLVQDMSGNEVKSLLGCSASEVSRRLHRGMEHLRQRLEDAFVVQA